MYKKSLYIALPFLLACAGACHNVQAQKRPENPFFVFNNGVADKQYDTPFKQAGLVKEMGFDGMESKEISELEETLEALDAQDLTLYTMYLNINLDNPEQPFDPDLEKAFKLLEGRKSMPWFYVTSKKYPPSSAENDAIAVPILRRIADMAAKYNLKIMLYPHVNFWVESVEDALRVIQKVDRPNLGLTFNLCHFFAVEGTKAEEKFVPLVERALPHVFAISLNGADRPTEEILKSMADLKGAARWRYFIQPLERGDYDTRRYLKAFTSRGFTGPVGLQCYGIEEEKRRYLRESVNAWTKMDL